MKVAIFFSVCVARGREGWGEYNAIMMVQICNAMLLFQGFMSFFPARGVWELNTVDLFVFMLPFVFA